MADIRINDLPSETSPVSTDVLPIDGASTRKTTLAAAVNAGRPLASQSEAEGGSNSTKAMTPLATKQAIAAQGAVSFASATQGSKADSALQPEDIGSSVQEHASFLDDLGGMTAGSDGQVIAFQDGLPVASDAGSGDMRQSVYDPQNISADAFDRANHTGTQTLATISDAGTAAASDAGDFATAAQGALADSAFQSANVIDEDDMASDSDTKVPTQQSVKAYVDGHSPSAFVADRTAMAALDVGTYTNVMFDGSEWEQVAYSTYSSLIDADTQGGIFVRSTNDATKAWMRLYAGHPSATWFGLSKSNTAADNTTALNGAIAVANAGYFPIFLPAGTFDHNTLNSFNGNGVGFIGSSISGCVLRAMHTTGDSITFSGGSNVVLRGFRMTAGVVKTSGWAVTFKDGVFTGEIDVRVDLHYNGVYLKNITELNGQIQLRYLLGIRGVQLAGNSSDAVYGATLLVRSDNPYPVATTSHVDWATSTAVTVGQMTFVNGAVFQCVVAGTTASSGSGPTIPTETDPSAIFNTAITDGSAQWKFVCRKLVWVNQSSNGFSLRLLRGTNLIDGYNGILMDDFTPDGTSKPVWLWFQGEIDHPFANGVDLYQGQGFHCTAGWVSSSLSGAGVSVDGGFTGDVTFDVGTEIQYNTYGGIVVQDGPTGVSVDGALLRGNGGAGSGNFVAAAGASEWSVMNARLEDSAGYGVQIIGTTSDYFRIQNCRFEGNAVAIGDSTTTTNKVVDGNL